MTDPSTFAPPNITSVSHAEQVVRACVAMHVQADHDPSLEKESLQRALCAFSDDVLRHLIDELEATGRYANYAFHHANGFFVLFLTDPEIGFQVRLHIWMPHIAAPREQPHRHRMSFVSRVLSGVLVSSYYDLAARGQQVAENGWQPGNSGIFHEAVIDAPAHSDFDYPIAEVRVQDTVVLRQCATTSYRRGDTYFFQASDIHCVQTPANLERPIITLTVWAPPFQESIAYEPVGSTGEERIGVVSVRRLEPSVFTRLLRMVRDSLADF